jgi:quinol monooxygenase YgiN
MLKKALFVKLHAKEGKERELEEFLMQGYQMSKEEEQTVTWHALKFDETTYGIFDTFEDEAGQNAHLNGDIAAALMAKKDELLAEDPKIEQIDLLAVKM